MMWLQHNTRRNLPLSLSFNNTHRTKSKVLNSFEPQSPNVADLISQNTHTLSLSLLPPWIIPVFLLSYGPLEKLSKPWAPEKTSHFERGHQRGQNRECPAILQVCVWRWGRIYVCDIGNWGSGGIHGVWGREMDRLCALVREWAECQFVSLPHILQAWHCESDQAALPLNSCVSVCVNGEGCIHVDSWVYISSELPHLNQHFIT